jgi:hypothetical protein
MNEDRVRSVVIVCAFMFLPAVAWGQAITGVVRDSSGAVLPGVAVEAASPALIEKMRTAVTDGQGVYQITELRPGEYVVTFTLSGFSTVRREGITLSTGFTASVNAELRVGAVTETVTVTGTSPVVDTTNVRTQTVVQRAQLDALPLAKSFMGYNALIPGMKGGTTEPGSRDVAGLTGESPVMPFVHGSDPGLAAMDGIKNIALNATADRHRLFNNTLTIQEVVVETGNGSAEAWSGGANVNIIAKDGGNTFRATFAGDYVGDGWDFSSISDGLRARGTKGRNRNKTTYDAGLSLGGPVQQDKLWFFVSPRWWGTKSYIAGLYYNLTPHTLFYSPDFSRNAIFERIHQDYSGRFTWQAAHNHKIVFQTNNGWASNVRGGETATQTPEAFYDIRYMPQALHTLSWTHPSTSRLLFESSIAHRKDGNNTTTNRQLTTFDTDRSVTEQSLGLTYGNWYGYTGITGTGRPGGNPGSGEHPEEQWHIRAATSYITGSHAFKVGFNTMTGFFNTNSDPLLTETYTFNNQLPVSLTQYAVPNYNEVRMNLVLGLFAQDQWTLGRMTLNLGVRYDSVKGGSPEFLRPEGFYLPAILIPASSNIPNWKDVRPRLGVAYDLFGNGKTALKASLGQYGHSSNVSLVNTALRMSPGSSLVTATSRSWNDRTYPEGDARRSDFVPDCNLKNLQANGECGRANNLNFGTNQGATQLADDVREGWGASPYIWEGHVELQHELMPRVGLTVGYFRTWWGNFTTTDNTLTEPADYNQYCVTAPTDSRLPNGGGYEVCGLYDVSFARFGQVNSLLVKATGQRKVYNGFDLLLNARLGRGIFVLGGLNTGHQELDYCASPDFPPQFCDRASATAEGLRAHGWGAGTDLKWNVIYPLPWYGIQTALTYNNAVGQYIQPQRAYTNAEIAPSLGRNLSSCPAPIGACSSTVLVLLTDQRTSYEARANQLDARLSKIFSFGRSRLQANVDLFNLINSDDVLIVQNRYGPNFLQALNVLPGRMIKISAQLDF